MTNAEFQAALKAALPEGKSDTRNKMKAGALNALSAWAGDNEAKQNYAVQQAAAIKKGIDDVMDAGALEKLKYSKRLADMQNFDSGFAASQWAKTPEIAQETAAQVKSEAQEILGEGSGAAGKEDIAALREYLSGLQQQETPAFSYDFDAAIDRFSNKSIDEQIDRATRALERSAANRGQFYSSDTLKKIADRAQSLGQENYQNALQLALQDKQTALDEYSTKLNADQARRAQSLQGLNALAGLGNTNISQLAGIFANATQGAGDTAMSYYGSKVAADAAKEEAEKTRKAQQEQAALGFLGSLFGMAMK